MKKLRFLCVVFSLIFVCAGSSQAVITFEDDFESYAYALNWNGGGTWVISAGTVDLIGAGTPFDLLPNGGMYVDLDGSTFDAGVMTASGILGPGNYTLSFDLAGNNVDPRVWGPAANPDEVTVQVVGGILLVDQTYVMQPTDLWTTYTVNFSVAAATPGSLSFANAGGDNAGALLDNVSLDCVIPAPSAVLLGGIGAALVGWLRRRRIV